MVFFIRTRKIILLVPHNLVLHTVYEFTVSAFDKSRSAVKSGNGNTVYVALKRGNCVITSCIGEQIEFGGRDKLAPGLLMSLVCSVHTDSNSGNVMLVNVIFWRGSRDGRGSTCHN